MRVSSEIKQTYALLTEEDKRCLLHVHRKAFFWWRALLVAFLVVTVIYLVKAISIVEDFANRYDCSWEEALDEFRVEYKVREVWDEWDGVSWILVICAGVAYEGGKLYAKKAHSCYSKKLIRYICYMGKPYAVESKEKQYCPKCGSELYLQGSYCAECVEFF